MTIKTSFEKVGKIMVNDKQHKEYLIDLKNRIYKILPMCEEKNENVLEHTDATLFEVKGLFSVIPSAKTSVWHIRAVSVLSHLSDNYSLSQLHDPVVVKKDIRREILNLLNIIDREIENLE